MTTIESIFSNTRYQFPILFKTNDLKSEVNEILTAFSWHRYPPEFHHDFNQLCYQ